MNTAATHLPSRDEIIARRERLWGAQTASRNLIAQRKADERRAAIEKERQETITASVEARRAERIATLRKQAAESKRYESAKADVMHFSTRGIGTGKLGELEASSLDLPEAFQRATLASIAAAVLGNHPGITLEDLRGSDRRQCFVLVRREVAVAIKRMRPDVSTVQLGRFLCKDHATILWAIKRFKEGNTAPRWNGGQGRIPEATVSKIKASYLAGLSNVKNGAVNNVSPTTVKRIAIREGWTR